MGNLMKMEVWFFRVNIFLQMDSSCHDLNLMFRAFGPDVWHHFDGCESFKEAGPDFAKTGDWGQVLKGYTLLADCDF